MALCLLQNFTYNSKIQEDYQQEEDSLQPKSLRICKESCCNLYDCAKVPEGIETGHLEVSIGWSRVGSPGTLHSVCPQPQVTPFLSRKVSQHRRFL